MLQETQAYNPRESAQPIGLSKVAKKLVDDSVDSEVRRISEAIDRSPFPATKSLAHMIIEAVASSPWSANKPPKVGSESHPYVSLNLNHVACKS